MPPTQRGKSPSKASSSNVENSNDEQKEQKIDKKTDKKTDKKADNIKMITAEQLGEHGKDAETQWVCIEGKVYDVTPYLFDHPGGPEIIKDNSGIDATKNFLDIGHSNNATTKLLSLYIGEMDGYVPDAQLRSAGSGQKGGLSPLVLIVAVLVAGGAFMYFQNQGTN